MPLVAKLPLGNFQKHQIHKIRFLRDIAFSFTLTTQMTFVLHVLHHPHEALVGIWNVHPLVENFSKLKLQSMQEGQLSSKHLLKGDDN